LLLRFFALHFHSGSYRRPMKDFLNRYMASNKSLEVQSEAELRSLFESTAAAIHKHIGHRAFRLKNAVNAAVLDAVMVGVAARLTAGPMTQPEQLAEAYKGLLLDQAFLNATTRSTADEESVKTRLRLSREAFAKVA